MVSRELEKVLIKHVNRSFLIESAKKLLFAYIQYIRSDLLEAVRLSYLNNLYNLFDYYVHYNFFTLSIYRSVGSCISIQISIHLIIYYTIIVQWSLMPLHQICSFIFSVSTPIWMTLPNWELALQCSASMGQFSLQSTCGKKWSNQK